MSTPRLPLVDFDTLPDEQQAVIGEWRYNLHRVLAHSPETLTRWMGFAVHILRENKLSPRDREIVILRVAWNCRSDYEWGLHAGVARAVGMGEADLAAVVSGPTDSNWSEHEAALIDAVDEMQRDWRIGDATWAVLAAHYRPDQLIDLVMVTGQFILVALALNSFDVPQEEGVQGLPLEK